MSALPPDEFVQPPEVGSEDRNHLLRRLMGPAARGDVEAFEALYNATARWMLMRVRRIVGDSLAEDVLSDVYLQVWRRLGSFDADRGQPLAWLMTIARSRALDRLRAERQSHGGLLCAPAAAEQGHCDGPEELLARRRSRDLLHAGIAALSAKERVVLGLAYFRECTQAEIATLTGLPLGTVKSLLGRSQQKLRRALAYQAPRPQQTVREAGSPVGLTGALT